jgi:hypothetical protein
MDGGVCADCKTLQQRALEATLRHLRAPDMLAFAKMNQDSQNIRDLEPIVERLFRERTAAVRTYREHFDMHAQEAESSLTKNRTEK